MPERLREELARAEADRPYLPLVVRATGNTRLQNWPNRELNKQAKEKANRAEFEAFLAQYNYEIIWTNGYLELLKN